MHGLQPRDRDEGSEGGNGGQRPLERDGVEKVRMLDERWMEGERVAEWKDWKMAMARVDGDGTTLGLGEADGP